MEDSSCILISLIILTFMITIWLQKTDDNKHNIKRTTIYDKYKFPFFWSSYLGLGFILLNIFNNNNNNLIIEQYLKNLPSSYSQEIYIDPFYQ